MVGTGAISFVGAASQAEVVRSTNQLAATIRFAYDRARFTGYYYRIHIDFEKRSVRSLRFRFLNSHGGANPGAALIFLIAGPATNAASLTMVSRLLGRHTMGIYLTAVIGCSLFLGFMTDQLYSMLQISPGSYASPIMVPRH